MKVMAKTECCVCGKDLGRGFEIDLNKNEMAKRYYQKCGKVVSHGYCTECYETHVQSQMSEFKAVLAKAAV